jgi:hypothetical protein
MIDTQPQPQLLPDRHSVWLDNGVTHLMSWCVELWRYCGKTVRVDTMTRCAPCHQINIPSFGSHGGATVSDFPLSVIGTCGLTLLGAPNPIALKYLSHQKYDILHFPIWFWNEMRDTSMKHSVNYLLSHGALFP